MKNQFRINDFNQRLDGCIVRFEGKPMFVRVTGNGDLIRLFRLKDVNEGNRHIHQISGFDERIDVSSIPLGYMNHGKYAVYLQRRPLRRFVQGISERSLTASSRVSGMDNFLVRISNLIHSDSFENSVLGIFPTVPEAMKSLRKNDGTVSSIAISQKVALNIDDLGIIKVFFREVQVGWIAPDTNVVNIPSSDIASLLSKEMEYFDWKVE